ncbi:Dihydroorotase [Piedraia hortae CBS 480.64]|uniref:dihydroorotase n=1 Tax=Piedraia hortae CBS 480.64 TaxID=1314780 RepID=A0A6A7C2W1_9PEZI|nr:Dihydroorotase [Piedraia hortae CBS 480.64]
MSSPLQHLRGVILPAAADMHVHLRSGTMSELVVPTIRQGGVNTVFVMPNLQPPVTSVEGAMAYKAQLEKLEPGVEFLMSLYLHGDMTPATITAAKKAGIAGVKSYPQGLTTNSDSGVVSYEDFYPVFAEMERLDMVLNLHGEVPSSQDVGRDVTVLNAEEEFLPILKELHARFPKLRIVLEHCTTAAAIETVKACGPTVAATITAHHLFMVVDDWAGDPHCYCKPVAKLPRDRWALVKAVVGGNKKFFFGSDSAPHAIESKRADSVAAGVFTQPHAVGYVVEALAEAVRQRVVKEEEITEEGLANFLSGFGRRFYKLEEDKGERIRLVDQIRVVDVLRSKDDGLEVVLFKRGQMVWGVEWV